MANNTELRKAVYNLLLNHIQFGTYRYGEKLPTIEEASARLCVSIDTARAAYLQLKSEGYITLSKNIGAIVKVNYSSLETEQFIQSFFSTRKKAMIDLGNSMKPLFGNARWIGLKNASPDMLNAIEKLSRKNDSAVPYAMLEHFNQKYSVLGNSLFMRLAWQAFMFLQAPFFSIAENTKYFSHFGDYLSTVLKLHREKNWPALRVAVDKSLEQMSLALNQFYEDRITQPPPEKETSFIWSSYKKSQQLCYSLAMELLICINQGVYPVGSLLPPQEELAQQKNVSVSTVRRAFGLLSSVGAVKSEKYVGTQVLPFDKATENSDFTKPILHRRFLDMAESLQVLALSCRDVSLLTLSSLDAVSIEQLCQKLKKNKERQRSELLSYFTLNLIAKSAPYQAIRTVYSELLRQFFWANVFQGMKGNQEVINRLYAPYEEVFIESLEKRDFPCFSAKLEELIIHDLRKILGFLSKLGVTETEKLFIPDESKN